MHSIKTNKRPWPTKAAMEQIYELGLWGGNGSRFYSGSGSHHPEMVTPYVAVATSFLKSFETPLTVVDLGCGDFNIGKQLVPYTKKYIAVDVVQDLINFNSRRFKDPKVEFRCMDIAKGQLPKGDCAIIRHVLQHLSNSEVSKIVEKLSNYNYLILTEHLPEGDFTPNLDIISGQGIRLKKQSGLDLLKTPFCLKVKEKKELLCLYGIGHKGVIVTNLFRMF